MTDQVNEQFSLDRLRVVQVFLSQQGVPADKAFDPFNHKFFGEEFAREHDPDNTDVRDFRVVCIGLWMDLFKVRNPRFLKFRSFQFGRSQEVLEL